MKYVIVIPDGCADEPQESLDGKTPLEAARTPAMDAMAVRGIVGAANHTPSHLPAGSAVANMSLLGYDPTKNFTGRAPLEAAAQGVHLGPDDWAIRCNLVTIQKQVMKSFTAGHVSSAQARELLATAIQQVTNPVWQFVPGVSYRNLLIYRGVEGTAAPFSMDTRTTPPHDLTDQTVDNDFPRGPGCGALADLMNQSVDWFSEHPVNQSRRAAGMCEVTNMWLWGLGQQPNLQSFQSLYGLSGAMITAVDLLRGLASIVGWDCIAVPGATGYIDTDYAAKGKYAIDALSKYDIVCIHIEASDEASHEGDVDKKVSALESVDTDIVAPLLKHLEDQPDWRMMVTPDHPTFIRTKTHTHGDVPFVMCGTGVNVDGYRAYNEKNAIECEHQFSDGFTLLPKFLSTEAF